MKTCLVAGVIALTAFAGAASAEDIPCEKMLADLRAALQDAHPSDADAATIKDLEDKGIERCTADDDEKADEFFGQALKLLGK